MTTICIIGGGAAGFFAAITAAEENPETRVTLLEAGPRTLAKVTISGGGRCNVTHNCFDVRTFVQAYPRGEKELLSPFSKFQASDTVEWFQSRGVMLKAEEDGRMFPVTDDSETIVHCLESAARDAGVIIKTRVKVIGIERDGTQFQLLLKDNDDAVITADKVLLATGSSKTGFEFAESLGHSIISPVPSLFTFEISDKRLDGLSGISVPSAELRLECSGGENFEQNGPLLITHWGLSGPAVLKLSAWAARPLFESNYQATLLVNWVGGRKEEIFERLLEEKEKSVLRLVANTALFALPKRLWERLTFHSGIGGTIKWADVSKQMLADLAHELTAGRYVVTGKGIFKEEFVTCGGVPLTEVDFRTMQSKLCPGLYFAGEILDIDAITGGYNFQAAWTTGWLAGKHLGL